MTASRLDELARSFSRHYAPRAKPSAPRRSTGRPPGCTSGWLEAHGRTANVDELTRAGIREWLATLAETREPGTVRTRY